MAQRLSFLLAFLALGVADAWACRCGAADGTVEQQVQAAFDGAIFVAEVEVVSTTIVTETRRVNGERLRELDGKAHEESELYPLRVIVSQLNILKVWKGGSTVTSVETGYVGSTCGNVTLKPGDKLLLYAGASEIENRVATGGCSRTRPLADADEDIDILRKIGNGTTP